MRLEYSTTFPAQVQSTVTVDRSNDLKEPLSERVKESAKKYFQSMEVCVAQTCAENRENACKQRLVNRSCPAAVCYA